MDDANMDFASLFQRMIAELSNVTGIPWVYHHWAIPPPYPYGVLVDSGDDPLYADNTRYLAFPDVRLELYDAVPNPALEKTVENWLYSTGSVLAWEREPRTTLDDETGICYLTAYEMEANPNGWNANE